MSYLHIFLPVAGISVNVILLLGMGLVVGFLAGLFGIGGGFLLTPLLIMIGIPPTAAAASDSNQIVAATASGTIAHWRLGNVDFKMGSILTIGGLIGGTLGVRLIRTLRAAGNADSVIRITYVIMLGIIGSYMFQESLRSLRPRPVRRAITGPKKEFWFSRIGGALPFVTHFEKSGVNLSIILPLVLGGLVGMLSAVMGVGGGFIMVPVMLYLLRMPMHVVIGTNLFQEFFVCINVTFMQSYYNHTVDLVIALLLLAGSTTGAQVGARVSNRLRADYLKIILATIVLFVMVKMAMGLLLPPATVLSFGGGR
jgi:uncharacterized membrane protein YfcA